MDEIEADRRANTIQRAWWIAMSGAAQSWEDVQGSLLSLGLVDAPRWLSDPYLRQRLGQTCAVAGATRPGPTMAHLTGDEAAVWQVVMDQQEAYWMRDLPKLEALYRHAPSSRFWAHVGSGGATVTNGWDSFLQTLRMDFATAPEPNPLFAYGVRMEDHSIRVVGDMAMVTFRATFPTTDMPGFHGPETVHQMIIFERWSAAWVIAGMFILDDQFGQTEAPMWEIDPTGHIIRQNSAATRHASSDSDTELRVRHGAIHLSDEQADRRLHAAISAAASVVQGRIMAETVAFPVVFDPGNDCPARIWWAGRRGTILYVALDDPKLLGARVDRAAAAYGLSPAQRRITDAIVAGKTLAEAAAREGVQFSTARTQLQRVFNKVGVRSQPELVRSLLAVTGPT